MKFTSIIAALVAAALTGQATGIKLKFHYVEDPNGNRVEYNKLYDRLMT